MRRAYYILGIMAVVMGLLGGWQWLADRTGEAWLNELSKDQVSLFFGITWILIHTTTQEK